MKKIASQMYVNKAGRIPDVYKYTINELIENVERLENNMITDSISYGIVKSYKDWDLWFEPITDTIDGFVMRKNDGSIIGIFPEQGDEVNQNDIRRSNYTHKRSC